jgi:putative ABC transport system permease protein
MGYNDVYLLQVVFQEALILAILGFLPGSSIAISFYALTHNATTLPLVMTVDRAATVLILTIIMCLLSGAVATRKLRLADPADIF